MKVYKKLLAYVPAMMPLVYIAILSSVLACLLINYGYYLIYGFLKKLVLEANTAAATTFAVKIAAFILVGNVIYFFAVLQAHRVGLRLETVLKKRGAEGLSKAGFRFFDTHPSGTVRKVIDDNTALTHKIVAHMIPDNTKAMITPVIIIALGFSISVRVGVCIFILTLLAVAILMSMMRGSDFMKVYQEALDKLSGETVEYIRGISVIKIFGVSVSSMKKLFKLVHEYSDYAYKYSQKCKKPYVIYQCMFFGLLAILTIPTVFCLSALGDPRLLALDLVMILFLAGLMFAAMMQVMYVNMYIFQGNYAVDTLEKLYAQMAEDEISFGQVTTFADHSIEFKNVTFAYADKNVLENLSFKLDQGKIYALVGASGSGKSTVAKLICAYYKIKDGKILIGGKRAEEYTQEALIKEISFVFQDNRLFSDTIYNNVAMARENATHDEIMRAMSLAGLDSLLASLEQHEQTRVGSDGIRLSGGEAQRVAIARAILKDSPIVIMDEASASVDPDNEHELQKAFKHLMHGKTVVMIAHRLSAIKGVDEILLVDDGKIAERGSHDELMAHEGKYKRLYNMYTAANEWRVSDETISNA